MGRKTTDLLQNLKFDFYCSRLSFKCVLSRLVDTLFELYRHLISYTVRGEYFIFEEILKQKDTRKVCFFHVNRLFHVVCSLCLDGK